MRDRGAVVVLPVVVELELRSASPIRAMCFTEHIAQIGEAELVGAQCVESAVGPAWTHSSNGFGSRVSPISTIMASAVSRTSSRNSNAFLCSPHFSLYLTSASTRSLPESLSIDSHNCKFIPKCRHLIFLRRPPRSTNGSNPTHGSTFSSP